MKVLIKYIWTLVLIPALVFLKGDLSFDTYMYLNNIKPSEEITKSVKTITTPQKTMPLVININAIAKNKNFSADGLPVILYDEQYNLLQKSQVVQGKVHFTLPMSTTQTISYKIISPLTADEMNLDNIFIENTLSIHESQMNELMIH